MRAFNGRCEHATFFIHFDPSASRYWRPVYIQHVQLAFQGNNVLFIIEIGHLKPRSLPFLLMVPKQAVFQAVVQRVECSGGQEAEGYVFAPELHTTFYVTVLTKVWDSAEHGVQNMEPCLLRLGSVHMFAFLQYLSYLVPSIVEHSCL